MDRFEALSIFEGHKVLTIKGKIIEAVIGNCKSFNLY